MLAERSIHPFPLSSLLLFGKTVTAYIVPKKYSVHCAAAPDIGLHSVL